MLRTSFRLHNRNYPAMMPRIKLPVISPRLKLTESGWARGATKKFLSLIRKTDKGCWEWIGSKYTGGYGGFNFAGRRSSAHRVSHELFLGPIPSGLVIDHKCRNPGCVNPDHLEAVTAKENSRRGVIQFRMLILPVHGNIRDHCPQGHPYDSENTYHYGGRRYCRECGRVRQLDYVARNHDRVCERRRLTRKSRRAS